MALLALSLLMQKVGVIDLVLQSKVLKLAHDATDVVTSIYSGIYNVGIGAGALICGQVYNTCGLGNVGHAGFIFVLIALALMIVLKFSVKKAVQALEAR